MAEIKKTEPTKEPIRKEPIRKEPVSVSTTSTTSTTSTPISTATSVFTPPPSTLGQNTAYLYEQELNKICRENPNDPRCIEIECRKNPFSEKCRPELTSGDGAGTFNTLTGVSSLETSQENLNFCLKNPNDPSCRELYNTELIESLDGGIDNIYATSLELPSDCLTNPSKVDINSCEGLHPKDIYQVMDKAQVNEPMQEQAPLQDQVGVSNLTENPITDTKITSMPTLSMYSPENDCKNVIDPAIRISNRPKVMAKRNFGSDLNPVTKKSSGNFFKARNPMGDGLDIYNKSFQNPLEYL
jgi:hypothetical protein